MAYIIKACADQSEAINTALSRDSPKKSYHLHDVLPRGEEGLKDKKNRDALSSGLQPAMAPLISPDSPATYNKINLVVWKGEEVMFDKPLVLCFHVP